MELASARNGQFLPGSSSNAVSLQHMRELKERSQMRAVQQARDKAAKASNTISSSDSNSSASRDDDDGLDEDERSNLSIVRFARDVNSRRISVDYNR